MRRRGENRIEHPANTWPILAPQTGFIVEHRSGDVVLVIEDDGVGLPAVEREVASTAMRLAGMRAHAPLIGATFQIESSPSEGTIMFVRTALKDTDA